MLTIMSLRTLTFVPPYVDRKTTAANKDKDKKKLVSHSSRAGLQTVLCFDALLQLVSGMDLQFEWDEVEAFVRQPDGSLFNWCERFCCFTHLLYGITFILIVLFFFVSLGGVCLSCLSAAYSLSVVVAAIAAMDLLVLAATGCCCRSLVCHLLVSAAAMDLLVLAAVGMAAPYVTQGLAYREYAWKYGASDGKQKPIVCYEV
ncbi:hypothetical protein IFM89_027219 [Coptis chinensis]|uniref:Uncharacterized protein n=1 Tax=Coptis chinensis TaxID=261450 RepID=A0A835LF90_9MAGN|nr:hypothetical protein IFM89_027219 [Coptis chinensis]